jgi:hypothetical protein
VQSGGFVSRIGLVMHGAVDVTVALTGFAEQDAVIETGGEEQGVQEPMVLLDDPVGEQEELYIVVIGEQLVEDEHAVSGGQVETVDAEQLWEAETVIGVQIDEQLLDTVTGTQLDPLADLDVCDGQGVGKIVVTELQEIAD